MATRIYKVTSHKGTRLIDAGNKQQALAHVARGEIEAVVATGHDIATLVGSGTKVEALAADSTKSIEEESTQ